MRELNYEVRSALINSLSPAEYDYLFTIKNSARHDEFLVGRGMSRVLLTHYLGLDSVRQLLIQIERQGKPVLDAVHGNVFFSVSHSASRLVIAVTRAGPLGVDVQVDLERRRDYIKIAGHFYHPREFLWFIQQPESERARAFYKLWTLRESLGKALGSGLGLPPHTFCIYPDQEGRPKVDSSESGLLDAARWHLEHFFFEDPDFFSLATACAVSSPESPPLVLFKASFS